jgi:hypothetical protein
VLISAPVHIHRPTRWSRSWQREWCGRRDTATCHTKQRTACRKARRWYPRCGNNRMRLLCAPRFSRMLCRALLRRTRLVGARARNPCGPCERNPVLLNRAPGDAMLVSGFAR